MKKFLSFLFYLIALLFLLVYVACDISKKIYLSEFGRLFFLCTSSFFMYFGGVLMYKNNKKIIRINLWIYFILYLILFITLTLFDEMWGRSGVSITSISLSNINLIPFKTIIGYFKEFNSLSDTRTIMFNLFGNFAACMPLALFLPLLFKRQNNIKIFMLTTILIVFVIEFFQLITHSGSFDIDDFILNVLGAVVMYYILRIKSINNIIRNIFLLEKNSVEKKSIIKIILILFIVILSVVFLIKYRKQLYNHNYNELMSKYNYTLDISDESGVCAEALEKFYEDDLYIYYFSCIKSDRVYAIINNEKFLVKDLLNNNETGYNITISSLEDAGLDFIKESK